MIGAVNSSFAFGATYQVRTRDAEKMQKQVTELADNMGKKISSIKPTGYDRGAGSHYNIVVKDFDGSFFDALKKLFNNDAFIVSK